MGIFNRDSKQFKQKLKAAIEAAPTVEVSENWNPTGLENKSSSYIEVFESKKGNYSLRIKSGNNKIKFSSEIYYAKSNARRAAKRFATETGLKIVDRSK